MDASEEIDPIWAPRPELLPQWFHTALAVPRNEGFVEVDGTRIHYFRWGDRSLPPVLMTHGFLAHARCFAFIAPFLAGDHHVVAYDLSGMGDSAVRPGCDERARGEEMIGVAEVMGLFDGPAKPVIVAHSFGSAVGLTAMALASDRFAGIILCDLMILRPATLEERWSSGGTSPGSGDPDKPHRRYPDYATARSRYVLSPPQPAGEPFLLDYMAFHSLRQDEEDWSWKFDPEVFRRYNAAQEWREMGHRVVATPGRKAIVHGEESSLFTSDSAAYVRELGGTDIPIIAIPEARHHLMLEQPMGLTAVLRAVLQMWLPAGGRTCAEPKCYVPGESDG